MSWKLKCPFTAVIAGPSSSGKTEFALTLISQQESVTDLKEPFSKVIWCHGVEQSPVFDRLRQLIPADKLQIVEGFPSADIRAGKLLRGTKPKLLILDDLLQEVEKDPTFFHLFTKISHHTNSSVIFISQVRDNIFS
jgi:septin family protein